MTKKETTQQPEWEDQFNALIPINITGHIGSIEASQLMRQMVKDFISVLLRQREAEAAKRAVEEFADKVNELILDRRNSYVRINNMIPPAPQGMSPLMREAYNGPFTQLIELMEVIQNEIKRAAEDYLGALPPKEQEEK